MLDSRALFDAVRDIKGRGLTQAEVDRINALLDPVRAYPVSAAKEPPWLTHARKDIGLREIPGKVNAPRIVNMLKLLRYPFSDDETAWCGTAMAAWFTEVGIAPPLQAYRAANWRDWGVPCQIQVGSVCVKSRDGGNHVFMAVGITPNGKVKGLGANQSNMVSIVDFAREVIDAVRWPPNVAQLGLPLPIMAAGTIASNEA